MSQIGTQLFSVLSVLTTSLFYDFSQKYKFAKKKTKGRLKPIQMCPPDQTEMAARTSSFEHSCNVISENVPLVGKPNEKKTNSFYVLTTIILMIVAAGYFLAHRSPADANQTSTPALRPLPNHPAAKKPKYTATQFVSFTISTFGGFQNKGECEGKDVEEETGTCYLGNKQNLTEDVEHRLKLLYAVLDGIKADKKAEEPKIDHRKGVLKIFMVPEFYFRGPDGAYPMEELLDNGILLDTANKINDYISVPEFSDYLFVFGTVIAASWAHTNNAAPFRQWDVPTMQDDEVLYYNFAPVFRGGPEKTKYIFTKKSISTIDFLSNVTMLPNPMNNNVKSYDDVPEAFKEMLEDHDTVLVQDNVIDVDGVRVGVEVCLDHLKGLLWSKLQQNNDDLVDVLLITSAGMAIEMGPSPIAPGGVVYMSDGGATSAACWRSSEDTLPYDPERVCQSPTPKGIKHYPPVASAEYSSFFTMAACENVEDMSLMEGYYSVHQTQGCSYSLSDFGIAVLDETQTYFWPSLEYYPTVDLPKH
jgi:hypothetical protein